MTVAQIVSLVGFARAMPDVLTFSTPIFLDAAGEYVMQEQRDGLVKGFERVYIGEEFVECPLRLALRVDDLSLICFEAGPDVFLIGDLPALRPTLQVLSSSSDTTISEATKAAIRRELDQEPLDQLPRVSSIALVVQLSGNDALYVANLVPDMTSADLIGFLATLSPRDKPFSEGLALTNDSTLTPERLPDDVSVLTSRLSRALDLARLGSFDWLLGQGGPVFSVEGLRVFGLGPSARLEFRPLLRMLADDDRRGLVLVLREIIKHGTVLATDIPATLPDGRRRIVYVEAEPEFNEHGDLVGYSGIVQDVTERRLAEDKVRDLANFDTLTGLPNRRQLLWRVERALEQGRHLDHEVAVLLIDLDRLKIVNDTLGHGAGDELLEEVSRRLRACVNHSDQVLESSLDSAGGRDHRSLESVCRLDGDQFVVLLPEVADEQHAERIASRMLDLMREPIFVGGQECFVTASIGIALFPRDGSSVAELLRNADLAMYSVKSAGRNSSSFYRPKLSGAGREKLELERALYKAIEREELVLHYQPKIDVRGARMNGAEALVRWRRHGTLLPPGSFIPLAEETGFIVPLSEWAIHEAARQARLWKDSFGFSDSIAVNLPGTMFGGYDLFDLIDKAVTLHGLPHSAIELEITETGLMRDLQNVIPSLHRLSEAGVQISIDDFGTGYSSLAYLTTLPISELKIDRAFVRDVAVTPQSSGVVTAIIALARSLKLRVVAEGVENLRQMEALDQLGCDSMQGHLFCKPQPAEDIERWLEQPVLPKRAPWTEHASLWVGSRKSSLAGRG